MKKFLKKTAKKIARPFIRVMRKALQIEELYKKLDAIESAQPVIDYESIKTLANYIAHDGGRFETELAITAIMKDEGPYLREWIEYHKIVGVDKFYLYDHASVDNTVEILKPYIEKGEVVYERVEEIEGQRKPQIAVYNDALQKHRNKSRYIAFIDLDEFIVPVSKQKITDILFEIERKTPFTALAVHWVCFGYNGHAVKPDGLVIENYTKSDRISPLIKSIVNPRAVIKFGGTAHSPVSFFGFKTRNENGIAIHYYKGDIGEQDLSITHLNMPDLRINHYVTKSYEEFAARTERNRKGNPWLPFYSEKIPPLEGKGTDQWRIGDYFSEYPDYEDNAILRFVPQVKEALRAAHETESAYNEAGSGGKAGRNAC